MHPSVERLLGLLDHLASVVRGLRVVIALVAAASVLGGLLLFSGLLRFGLHWFLSLIPAVFCVIPAFVLFGLWKGLDAATGLPEKVRALPHNTGGLTDDFTAVASALANAKERPKTPGQVWRSLKASKEAYDAFGETSIGGVVGGATSLHPAGLAAGWFASLWAVGYFVVGLIVNLLSGVS